MAAKEAERHSADGWLIVPFATAKALETWLDDHHTDQPGLWIKFAKKSSGIDSITLPEAVEVATCFGWIDSKQQRYDDNHFVLRFQPRRPKSNWAVRSKALAERLIAEGRMRPTGRSHVDAAKADGRWDVH